MHPNSVSNEAITLIKQFEGLHRQQKDGSIVAYKCPAGKYTIGWGHVKGVKPRTVASVDQCEEWLRDDIESHAKAIYKYVNVPLTQGQFDALASFIFNLGETNFRKSTLLKKLNKGLYDEVPAEIMKWNKARVDGVLQPLKGLTRRRTAEAAIFTRDTKLAGNGGEDMPQRVSSAAPKPLHKSRTMAGAGVAGASTALAEVTQQVQDLVPYSDIMRTVFLFLAVAGIALAAYARWDDHKEGER